MSASRESTPLSEADATSAAIRHNISMFRGVEALTLLLKARRSLGITQIASELNLPKSTSHDLVAALSALGFVDQNPTTRRYSISPEIFRFLHLFSSEYGPNVAVRRLLRTEARKMNASLFMTALCRHQTYALCASGPDADTFVLGASGPAYNSSCGKVLVAHLDEAEWPEYAPKPTDEASSPHAQLDPARFLAEMRTARASGVAWNLRERDGISCSVAAPIPLGEKPWLRAVGIALPFKEWVVRDREELAASAKQIAGNLAAALIS